MPPRTPRQLRARQATLLRSVSACDCDNCTLCDDRMGLRLTLFRHTLQSVRGLCCGRVESPSAAVASAAAPRAPRLTPRVAIRVGVDAGGAPEEGAAAEGQQQQRREKRAKREKPPPPPRPTHFLALQVSQCGAVCDAIRTVQAALAQHSPHLRNACVDASSAHLTLGVMALPGEGERQRAAQALAALAGPLAERALLSPLELELEGLSHFRNRVLYLDVRPGEGLERLLQLAAAARAHFQAEGLLLQAEQAFTPHVTIAKTSKLQGGGFGGRRGRGGRRHGHGRGRHGWREERQHQRDAKQQRLEMQAEGEGALAAMDWGAESAPAETAAEGPAGGSSAAAASVVGDEGPQEAAAAAALAADPPSSSAADASMDVERQQQPPAGEEPPADDPEQEEGSEHKPQHTYKHKRRHEQRAGGEAGADGPNWREIDAEAWSQHVAISGGAVVVAELQLCAMQGRKPGDYYPVLCSLQLAPAPAAGGSGGEASPPAMPASSPEDGGPAAEVAAPATEPAVPAESA